MAIGKQTEQEASVKSIGVPYVKNTFLCVGPAPEPAPPRSISLSPKGSSDGFARQLHALMYRPTPVRQRPAEQMKPEQQETVLAVKASSKKICRFAKSESEDAPAPPFGSPLLLRSCSASSGDETGSSTDVGELLPASPPSVASPHSPDSRAEDTNDETEERVVVPALLPRLELSAKEFALLPSIGSVRHEEGSCKPCVFAHNDKKACENGKQCPFCHFPHAPKKRVRLCKKKRMEMKRLQQEDQQNAGSEESD